MADTAMKAIETNYGGHRFRSRLEARWAVFFTNLDLNWDYEPQGFIVGRAFHRARPYLPDFYLPHLGLYIEIKPAYADRVDPDGVSRWEDFAGMVATEWDHDRAVMSCGPIPDPLKLDRYGPPRSFERYGQYGPGVRYDEGTYAIGGGDYAWCSCPSGGHFDVQPDARGGRIFCGCPRIPDDRYRTGDDLRILNAYAAARAARFEHGDCR